MVDINVIHNQTLGPSNIIKDFLRDEQNKAAPIDTTVIILFNTNLRMYMTPIDYAEQSLLMNRWDIFSQ